MKCLFPFAYLLDIARIEVLQEHRAMLPLPIISPLSKVGGMIWKRLDMSSSTL